MSSHGEEVLRSFLEELLRAEPHLQACLSDRSTFEATPKRQPPQKNREDERLNHHQHQLEHGTARQQPTAWAADPLRRKLRELSALREVSDERRSLGTRKAAGPDDFAASALPPGLVYSVIDALVRFVARFLPLVDPSTAVAAAGAAPPSPQQPQPSPPSQPLVKGLVDLALLGLANLLESPSWRHVFFAVLHEVQRERHRHQQHPRAGHSGGGGAKPSGASTSLQEYLWRRIVADAPAAGGAARSGAKVPLSASSPSAEPRPVPAVDQVAVRLCCGMVRHCPLSFSASSYASLAPHLTDYLLGCGGGGGSGGGTATTDKEIASQNDLTVLLDLFAACARGSPHFRQYVKGLRRKRELFRRLLGFLGPRCDGVVVVRALCALTRVLAGDPLEGKVRKL